MLNFETVARFVLLWVVAALLALLPVKFAWSDSEADYQSGVKSFRENDHVTAMPPLRRASDQGHTKAMVLLADILNIAEQDVEAVALYRKAAEKDDPAGMVGLGAMLATGEGVKKDVPMARSWITKAAEMGFPDAINMLASSYLTGGALGLDASGDGASQALHWVSLAAKQDYLPAVDALHAAYTRGDSLGVSKDPALAKEYAAQSARIRGASVVEVKKRKAPR